MIQPITEHSRAEKSDIDKCCLVWLPAISEGEEALWTQGRASIQRWKNAETTAVSKQAIKKLLCKLKK